MPAGTVITSEPGRAFASWIAARSVQAPPAVAQIPLPVLASPTSAVLLTVKLAAGVGVAVGVGHPSGRHGVGVGVGSGVSVAVGGMGVGVAVGGIGVGGIVGRGHATHVSYAPMSQVAVASPSPSNGRAAPRWSVAGGGQSPLPASIAGLPASRACVKVGPPLLASTSRSGLALLMSPAAEKPHVLSLSKLCPREVMVPEQSFPLLLATIVFLKVTTANWRDEMPPVPLPVLPLTVLLLRCKAANW